MAEQIQPTAAPALAPTPAKPAAPAERVKGQLTRHGMEKAIKAGGSVLHKGVIVTSLDKLPTDAELSEGDTAAEEAARASIADRQAQLDREKAILDSRHASDAKKK